MRCRRTISPAAWISPTGRCNERMPAASAGRILYFASASWFPRSAWEPTSGRSASRDGNCRRLRQPGTQSVQDAGSHAERYLLPITQLTSMTAYSVALPWVREKRGCHGRHDGSGLGGAELCLCPAAAPAADPALGSLGGENRGGAREALQPGFRLERAACLLQPLRSESGNLAHDPSTPLGADTAGDGPAAAGPDSARYVRIGFYRSSLLAGYRPDRRRPGAGLFAAQQPGRVALSSAGAGLGLPAIARA